MKKTKPQKNAPNNTTIAIWVAALAAFGAVQAAEIIYNNMRGGEPPGANDIPMWRAHMGSACAGSIFFVAVLFCLETLESKSKLMALRSILPWLPIVALTALGTAIHIPLYLVILGIAAYSPWAYIRTRAVH